MNKIKQIHGTMKLKKIQKKNGRIKINEVLKWRLKK